MRYVFKAYTDCWKCLHQACSISICKQTICCGTNVRLSLFHVFETAPHSSFNIFLSRAKRKNTQTPHFPFYSLTQQMCFYGAQPFSSFLFSSLHFIKHGHRGFTTQHFLSLATLMLPIKFSVAQFIMLMYNSTLLVSAQLEDMFAPKF